MMTNRTRRVIGSALGVLTIAGIAFAIHFSLDPGNYFFYRVEDRANWVYQPGHVVLVCGLMLAEATWAGAALLALRPRALWLRCLLALLVLIPWAFVAPLAVVHMPVYVLLHHMWVWLMVLVLALGALGSVLRQSFVLLRSPRRTDASSIT